MKLSTKGRYGVMAMVVLAQKKFGSIVPISTLAESQDISINYLEQIFNKLRHGGLVKSIRGTSGGYCLTREPCEITILDIMKAVGETFEITRCDTSSSKGCMKNGSARCLTHDLWADLGSVITGYLEAVTLEILKNREVKGVDHSCFSLPKKCSRPKKEGSQ